MQSATFILLCLFCYWRIILTNARIDMSEPLKHEYKDEWNVIEDYLEDQNTVSVYVDELFNDIAQQLFSKSRIPLYFYDDFNVFVKTTKLQSGDKGIFPSHIFGSIVITTNLTTIEMVMDVAIEKYVVIFIDRDEEFIKSLLKQYWSKFHSLELLTLIINSTTPTNNEFIIYNPFAINLFKEYGDYSIHKVNNQTSAKVSAELNGLTKNLNKYPINVFMDQFTLLSEPVYNSDGNIVRYDYLDGVLLLLIEQYLNFTINYVKNDKINHNDATGKLAASMKGVEMGLAEMAMNNRPLVLNAHHNVKYFAPADIVLTYFIVPKSYSFNHLNILIYNLYDTQVQLITGIILTSFSLFWFGVKYFWSDKVNMSYGNILMILVSVQNGNSAKISNGWVNRFLYISLLFYSYLTVSIYQGTILRQLSENIHGISYKTIQELVDSDLNLTYLKYTQDLLKLQDNIPKAEQTREALKLIEKTIRGYDSIYDALNEISVNRSTSVLISALYSGSYLSQFYDEKTGRVSLAAIPEVPLSIFLAYSAHKRCPYVKEIEYIQLLYGESGLKSFQINRVNYKCDLVKLRRAKNGFHDAKENRSITILDMMDLFYVTISLWFLSFVIFCGELLFDFFQRWCKIKKIEFPFNQNNFTSKK